MTPGRDTDSSRSSATGSQNAGGGEPSDSIRHRVYERLTPRFVRQRLALKFLVALSLVVVLIGVIGVVTYVQIQGTIQDDATTKLETTADLRAQSVGEWVEGMRSQTRLITVRLPDGGDSAVLGEYLQGARANGSETIHSLHYVDVASETVLASTDSSYTGESLTEVDQPWDGPMGSDFATADGVAVSDHSYTVDGEPAVAFVSRVSSDRRLVVVSRLGEHAGTSSVGGDVQTYLLNEQGEGVVGIGDSRAATLSSARAFSRAISRNGMATVESRNEVRTYAAIDGTDWVAVSTADTGTLYAVSGTVGRNVIVLVLAALISLCVVGLVLGRSTVVPLARLRQRTNEIESGSLDVDLSTSREDEIGRLYRAFDSMRDALASQVRQAQQARHEAESSRQEMERQNRRLDQFASTLSHDLRNPLAVARGHVELLRTKLDETQDDLREHVEKIDGAHDRIDSIIDDVLTLTRKGESVEETERFDLGSVAEEAWNNIDNKDATLRVEDSIVIEGERNRLLRAFENLFRNAIDHVGPEVTVTVGLTEDGFYVEDDGPGIPDEEMDNIFEYGHTTSESGTGLGLSIVKTIAEAHGWSLWVDGTSGMGARFVFSDVFASEERIFEESAFTWEHARQDD
ncbi:sensor histidine kinase [Halapricum salinum]|uniref:histidine kinase n=1 Tax=Halapricum salinum TaxID=1457250 RepID=A0A4D6H9K8_9EURY|nr:sensor histidine kinase [Halapricum salinum]